MLSPSSSIQVELRGNMPVANKLPPDFCTDIKDLLRRAGHNGQHYVDVIGVTAEPVRSGLLVTAPSCDGVRITWRNGSSDGVEATLRRPAHLVDSHAFYNQLRQAPVAVEGEDDEPVEGEEQGADAPAPAPRRRKPIVKDPKALEAVMLAVAKQANADGLVLKRCFLDIISTHTGYGNGGVGATARSLRETGHVETIGKKQVRVSSEWLKRLRPPSPLDRIGELGELLEAVRDARAKRKRLLEINQRLADIERLIDEKAALETKRADLAGSFDEAQLAKAELILCKNNLLLR